MALQADKVRSAPTGALSVGETTAAAPTGTGSALGTNEAQTVTITGTPTGGTFTLTFKGQTTAAIAYNATAAAVQSALEALSTIGAGNVTAAGGPLPGTAVTVTFVGNLGNSNVTQMTAAGSLTGGTSPAVAVTTTTEGAAVFTDLGYIGGDGEGDGVSQALPGQGDVTPIKAWQNGKVVRTFRSPTDENPSWTFVLLETKREVIELYYGATVTQDATEGSFSFDAGKVRPFKSYVLDVIDGAELERVYIPKGIVSEVGDVVRANGQPIGYEITIEGERDDARGYNFRSWATALKTP